MPDEKRTLPTIFRGENINSTRSYLRRTEEGKKQTSRRGKKRSSGLREVAYDWRGGFSYYPEKKSACFYGVSSRLQASAV